MTFGVHPKAESVVHIQHFKEPHEYCAFTHHKTVQDNKNINIKNCVAKIIYIMCYVIVC